MIAQLLARRPIAGPADAAHGPSLHRVIGLGDQLETLVNGVGAKLPAVPEKTGVDPDNQPPAKAAE